MNVGDTVKNNVVFEDIDMVIPEGSVGVIVRNDPRPKKLEEKHWYRYEVFFEGFMKKGQTFPCKADELSVA